MALAGLRAGLRPAASLALVGRQQDAQLGQRGGDRLATLLGERLEQLAGGGEQVTSHAAHASLSRSGQGEPGRAPVVRVGLPLEQPGAGERGRLPGDDRGADHQPARDLGGRARPLDVDHPQDVVLLVGE
jgi:hypothetical protein